MRPCDAVAPATQDLPDIEIGLGVAVTDRLHHVSNMVQVIRQLAFLDVPSQQITKDTPEVLVTGKGEKAS